MRTGFLLASRCYQLKHRQQPTITRHCLTFRPPAPNRDRTRHRLKRGRPLPMSRHAVRYEKPYQSSSLGQRCGRGIALGDGGGLRMIARGTMVSVHGTLSPSNFTEERQMTEQTNPKSKARPAKVERSTRIIVVALAALSARSSSSPFSDPFPGRGPSRLFSVNPKVLR